MHKLTWKEHFDLLQSSGHSFSRLYEYEDVEDDPWPTNTWPGKYIGRDSAIVFCDDWEKKMDKGGHFENLTETAKKVLLDSINKENKMDDTPAIALYADWINKNKEKDMRIAFGIKKVIFNKPATIVYWTDGTKTVVKCGEKEVFDPEKGLAMAFAKKALGNKGSYYNVFKKNIPEEEKVEAPVYEDIPFKNGDTVIVYESNKYSGMFDQKIGVIGNIKVYHGHVNIGIEFYGAAPNKRSETGLYYFDSSKVRKYSKPIPISPVDPVIACEKCIYADVTIAQYPCNDCCFGPEENRFKHYIEK